ncbi:DUF6090 family protein [Salinimicrobium sediminilitoris]|uniref:DUF6090 family protein n=1 Tax=Salinimicrobium sediminilitoris TaxID=2876715 RepID=UPI001E2906F6|nr:DUF6090 family protein [Salinimicrobium sediminilitoris]MCC8359848.1 hypothetical protein [Salinimicrobium sediminilitoris]
MINFFRKIRRGLLSENKFSKYLLYAIEEIILVVIGILIALQINNWNENRKDTIQEKVVLKNLLENLDLARSQSVSLISNEDTLKKRLIRILGIGSDPTKIVLIPDSIFKRAVWDLESDKPTFNAYDNLKNTDKLSLIKNKSISEKFTELEFRLNKLNDILEDRLSVHQIRIDDILEKEINFVPLVKSNVPEINIQNEEENDYNRVLTDGRIRNLLGMKLTFTQDVIDRRKDLDREINELIMLLQHELKQ